MHGQPVRFRALLLAALFAATLAGAAPESSNAKAPDEKNTEKKTSDSKSAKKETSPNRLETRYTTEKPCPIDKYNYFCCPIKRRVRVGKPGSGKYTYYYYNDRDELIGRQTTIRSGTNAQTTIVSLGMNCSRCRKKSNKVRRWNNRWYYKLAPPKK